MADPAGLTLHQSLFADANTIPTNRLQVEMLVVMYLTALLAYVIYGLRMYSKITSRQIGLGKDDAADMNRGASWNAVLTIGPLCRGLVYDGRHGSLPFLPHKGLTFLTLFIAQIFSMALIVAQYWCPLALL